MAVAGIGTETCKLSILNKRLWSRLYLLGIEIDNTLPPITMNNKIAQSASTSSSGASLDDLCSYDVDYSEEVGDYITDDDKISMGSDGGKIIDSYLEDFLQREDELRKLMNLNNFNRIITNNVEFGEKDDLENDFKISNEDTAILTDLEHKLADIQQRYNDIMHIHTDPDSGDETKIEDEPLEFEDAKSKLEEIDKCLEDINADKFCERTIGGTLMVGGESIQKDYINSLNEMTKKLDTLLGEDDY